MVCDVTYMMGVMTGFAIGVVVTALMVGRRGGR